MFLLQISSLANKHNMCDINNNNMKTIICFLPCKCIEICFMAQNTVYFGEYPICT